VLVKKSGILSWKIYTAMLCVVLIGTLAGCLLYGRMDAQTLGRICSSQADFISARGHASFSHILLRTLTSSSIFMLVVFLSGFGAIGHAAALGALGFKGMGLGLILSRMYIQYSVKGIVYSLFTIIPNAVVSAAVLALAAREAFSLSNTYALFTLSDRQHDGLRPFVKIYCAKLLILEAILALSAGCDCLIAWIFKSFVPK
jgi:stage II sporulation protein M